MSEIINDKAYQQVIDILVADTIDYKNIAIQLAKFNPELFLRFHGKTTVKDWMREVIQYMKDGEKASAIKTLRANEGIGLREAKDICDNLQNYLSEAGYCQYYYNPSTLYDRNKIIFEHLTKAV